MISVLYVPCGNRTEAESISHTLLEEKLIACANIIPAADSLYIWEGMLEQTQESILLVKTSPEYRSRVMQRIEELHSYSCPCIVEWKVEAVNPGYAKWVHESLHAESKPESL
jgi:periplasmic divalent cation tolerance protein